VISKDEVMYKSNQEIMNMHVVMREKDEMKLKRKKQGIKQYFVQQQYLRDVLIE
jgi:hypothetical protein